jgi:hypothetical protein
VQVDLAQRRQVPVRVITLDPQIALVRHLQSVLGRGRETEYRDPDPAVLMGHLHPVVADQRHDLVGPGAEHPQRHVAGGLVRAQDPVRVVV